MPDMVDKFVEQIDQRNKDPKQLEDQMELVRKKLEGANKGKMARNS